VIGRLFRRKGKSSEPDKDRQSSIGQWVLYAHLIIALKILFLLGLVAVIAVMGRVLVTPLWILLVALFFLAAGIAFLYLKAKKQVQELGRTLKGLNLAERNHEIKVMGGLLSIRVEGDSPKLLQPPANPASEEHILED
jgi:membrane protein implicated in regulation of membrane protease activity